MHTYSHAHTHNHPPHHIRIDGFRQSQTGRRTSIQIHAHRRLIQQQTQVHSRDVCTMRMYVPCTQIFLSYAPQNVCRLQGFPMNRQTCLLSPKPTLEHFMGVPLWASDPYLGMSFEALAKFLVSGRKSLSLRQLDECQDVLCQRLPILMCYFASIP